ncbi:MAG: hypothetical protein ABIJ26_08495 [Candidatus Margulisiibacteriota bacterium]
MKNWTLTLASVVIFLLFVWLMPREETTATWVIAGLILVIGGVVCVVLMIRKIWRGSLRD